MGFRFCYNWKTTDTNNLTLKYNNKIEGEIPIEALASKAPLYNRKWSKKTTNKKVDLKDLKKIKIEDALIKILSSPNHSNKSWITNQYDQSVMCDTVQKSVLMQQLLEFIIKIKPLLFLLTHQQTIANHTQ